jgi:nitrogen-specific signal transduction histidine kinase
MGGSLELESEPGRTVFRLLLPIVDRERASVG